MATFLFNALRLARTNDLPQRRRGLAGVGGFAGNPNRVEPQRGAEGAKKDGEGRWFRAVGGALRPDRVSAPKSRGIKPSTISAATSGPGFDSTPYGSLLHAPRIARMNADQGRAILSYPRHPRNPRKSFTGPSWGLRSPTPGSKSRPRCAFTASHPPVSRCVRDRLKTKGRRYYRGVFSIAETRSISWCCEGLLGRGRRSK